MKDNYPIVIFWSEGDEAFIADIPDLHYCSAHGDTPEEALQEILIAREAWLEMAHEKGIPLADPSQSPYLPEIARKAQPVVTGAS